MNSRLLIDAIVRQTTVLLAQLSTAAGIRAPLAHVADEVFVSLARDIEAQGVGRKVAADMFGLALRSYQKKIVRLTESATQREKTLWEATLDFIGSRGGATREQVLAHFKHDSEREVIGVLTDLVSSGLVHASGRGASAVYGITTDAERQMLLQSADTQSVAAFTWATIRDTPGINTIDVAEVLKADLAVVRTAVQQLVADGRVERESASDACALYGSPLVIAVGAEMGWEVAVFDHFRAVVNALAAKVRQGSAHSTEQDTVGGATLSFLLGPEHPLQERVLGLLARVREEANALWQEVEQHNIEHPVPADVAMRVWFYFGQYVDSDS